MLHDLSFKGKRKAGVPKYQVQSHVAVEYYVVFNKDNPVV
jgi:hypothetical protein